MLMQVPPKMQFLLWPLERFKDQNIGKLGNLMEKAMAPHFSILAWRIPGTAEPGRLPSVGGTESDMIKAT